MLAGCIGDLWQRLRDGRVGCGRTPESDGPDARAAHQYAVTIGCFILPADTFLVKVRLQSALLSLSALVDRTAVPPITRFAPSPTGYLHLGHAYSACLAARAAGPDGSFLLRLEDIDATRCTQTFRDAVIEDLHWLGLRWPEPVRYQSHHLDDYAAALTTLRDRGLLYPCFCTRRDILAEIGDIHRAPHGPDGPHYPGTCRSLSPTEQTDRMSGGQPYALRLNMTEALRQISDPLRWHDSRAGWQTASPQMFGDVVLARKDTPTSYHLAVTLDDARQGITLVTRGEDLFAATHIHRLLQALFDLPVPSYDHHPLLCGPDGKRYAKRDHSLTLRTLREQGETPSEIMSRLGLSA